MSLESIGMEKTKRNGMRVNENRGLKEEMKKGESERLCLSMVLCSE
jgi:hypothetical protein